jgi:hypothetical protein
VSFVEHFILGAAFYALGSDTTSIGQRLALQAFFKTHRWEW